MYAAAEVDALLSGPVHSSVKTRWERKASVMATPSANLAGSLAPRTPFAEQLNTAQPTPQQSKTPGKSLTGNIAQHLAKTPGKSLTVNVAQQLAQACKTPS